MKKSYALRFAVFFCLTLLLATSVSAEEQKPGEGAAMPEMGPPQEIKDVAKELVGDWKFSGRWRMDPESPWIDHTADATYSTICDGAAIAITYTGEMMGMMMHGYSIMTYDRETQVWQQVWVDNFGARMSLYEGIEEDGQIVFEGEDIMGGEEFYTRVTTSDIAGNSFEWKMENSMDGENWFVSMEGTYTRK